MIETLLMSYKRPVSPLLLDIDFEDAPIGSKVVVDKVSGRTLAYGLGTVAAVSPAAGVVNHPTYGKVMRLDGISRWMLANANLPNQNVTFEFEFAGIASEIPSETPFYSIGGSLGGTASEAGHRLNKISSDAYSVGYSYIAQDNGAGSGTSVKVAWPNKMNKVFADWGTVNGNFGIRDALPISGYYTNPPKGKHLYLTCQPSGFYSYPYQRGLVGYWKSFRVFANTLKT